SYTNGNISQMQWSGKAEDTFTKGLVFAYDNAGRLTGSSGLFNYKETESGITYDKNGNIKTLVRNGTAGTIDNLAYSYTGNRLSALSDGSGSGLGVKAGVSGYGYDGNGNMLTDGNRGAAITYNSLDLPKTVTIGAKTFSYDYDATGTKHQYIADTLTIKYAGGFEYNGANTFKRLALSDAQAVFRKDSLCFDYYLKDHLGNVRVVFDEKGKILQKTDYYPFGLPINRDAVPPQVQNWVNRYLYNGKELQVGSGYLDYGARMYMPEVGRWGVVDALAEKNNDMSGYSYAVNNPMLFTDPFGLDTSSANANVPVHQGDVILFGKGVTATQSVDEATIKGSRSLSNSNGTYNIEADLRWTQTLLFDHREEDDPTRLIDNTLGFISPNKALEGFTLLSKINPFVKTKSTIDLIKLIVQKGIKFIETKEFGRLHGQKIYQSGNKYYSRDADAHNGGVWKVFEKNGNKLKRIGTADENLNIFKK
uniref:RHS repeat-associated core domain-containing protein n=1 Tax=Dyadobacter bucti TaxID=2572203 RepID=UPI003F719072